MCSTQALCAPRLNLISIRVGAWRNRRHGHDQIEKSKSPTSLVICGRYGCADLAYLRVRRDLRVLHKSWRFELDGGGTAGSQYSRWMYLNCAYIPALLKLLPNQLVSLLRFKTDRGMAYSSQKAI